MLSQSKWLGMGFGFSVLLVGSKSVHIIYCYVMSGGRKF